MMRSFIVAGASRTAWTGGGLRKKRVAPTRPLCPFSPGTRRQALEEREERGPGDAEAVACFATLAGAPAERRGFLRVVEQPLDRAGERRHVPRLHHQAAALPDLRKHPDRR